MLVNSELTDDIGDPNLYGNGLINAQKAVVAALNAVGTPPADNPMLDVTPQSLNFGATSVVSEFTARNTGGGNLQINAPTFNANWLSVIEVAQSNGVITYSAAVNRNGLADGIYSDTITVQSNVNTVQISVIMQVSGAVIEADAGFLYVLLIDNDTDAVVDQVDVPASGGEYQYQFLNVPGGSYIVIAGTDSDNDFYICDSGEACGAYLTSDQPQVITLDQHLTNVDYPVGHVIAIPTQSLDADAEAPAGIRRIAERADKQLTQ
jgi:serine protease